MSNETDESDFVRQAYADALRRDPEERIAFIDRACAANSCARSRVSTLLDSPPLNIDNAAPKETDAGLTTTARIDDGGETRLTQTWVVVGTPTYLAPEQIHGRVVDHRTDIFALLIDNDLEPES